MVRKKGKLRSVVGPKTRRGRNILLARAPLLKENDKNTLFLRGATCSQTVQQFMKDLAAMKKPDYVYYGRKNDIKPFENMEQVEYYCKKHDTSLFFFGSHNKKRPDNAIIGRMFDHQLLDMIELRVEAYKGLGSCKSSTKCAAGNKPCLLFVGELFNTQLEYQCLKSLLIDFFRGRVVTSISLAGLDHVLLFAAIEGIVHFRTYSILMKKSGTKIPRIELEEMGPSANLVMRRSHLAAGDLFKQATTHPRARPKDSKLKNIMMDKLGNKYGRVHMQKMDLSKLQLRRVRALKKTVGERRQERALAKQQKRIAAAAADSERQ